VISQPVGEPSHVVYAGVVAERNSDRFDYLGGVGSALAHRLQEIA